MLDALAARDAKTLLDIADEMAARSLSWSGALQDLGTLLNRIAIAQTVPSAVPDDLPERDDIVRLAPMFSPEDVQLYYQIVVHGRHELGLAPDEYSGFTMTLLRMLAFAPIDGGGIAVAAPSAARAASSAGAPATPASSAAASAAASPSASAPAITKTPPSTATAAANASAEKPTSRAMAALAAARASKILTPAPSVQAANAFETAETPSAVSTNSVSAPVPTAAATISTDANSDTPARSTATVTANASGLDWPVLVKQLSVRGVARQLAMQSELLSYEDNGQAISIRIRVPLDTLLSAGSKEKLMTALSEHLGKNVQLDTEIGATTVTAHAADVAEEAQRQRQAEQTLQEDPFVQTLMREFGATIVPGSVRPL
jgi:DNA polymerase-3 subunit gamma/tau